MSLAAVAQRVESGVSWLLAPRRIGITLFVLLAIKLAVFARFLTHAPAIAGDETGTIAAVAELHERGDVLFVLHVKHHHPLPYLIMQAFVPPSLIREWQATSSPGERVPASSPILERLRLVALGEWAIAAIVMWLIARQVMARPSVAMAVFLAMPMIIVTQARPYALHLLLGLVTIYTSAAVLHGPKSLLWLAVPASFASLVLALHTFIFDYLYLPVFGVAAALALRRSPARGALLAGSVIAAFAVSLPYLMLWLHTNLGTGDQPHPLIALNDLITLIGFTLVAAVAASIARRLRRDRVLTARTAFATLSVLLGFKAIVYWGIPFAAIAAVAWLGGTTPLWWLILAALGVPQVLNPEPCFDHHVIASDLLLAVPLGFVLQHPRRGWLGTLAALVVVCFFVMATLGG